MPRLTRSRLAAASGQLVNADRFEQQIARTKLCPLTQPGTRPQRDEQAEEYVHALARAAGHLANTKRTDGRRRVDKATKITAPPTVTESAATDQQASTFLLTDRGREVSNSPGDSAA